VSLSDIERVVRALPNIADAAVVARALPSARGHEILLAVAGPGWDGPSMRAALLERLPAIAVPRRYRFVAELPREATGKLRRDNVLALFAAAPGKPTELERLSSARDDAKARVELRVPSDLLFFQGHFEGWPVLPGVAQLGLIAVRQVEDAWPGLGPLRRVRRLKMKQPIAPGDVLVLELTRVAASVEGEQRIDFAISRDGAVCTTGTLAFAHEQLP
jgi:3-hydroxymyristoyl/3-hydroxydecanoyl-(acyl carrier protein) dehydratase